jgi:hypothetical protein
MAAMEDIGLWQSYIATPKTRELAARLQEIPHDDYGAFCKITNALTIEHAHSRDLRSSTHSVIDIHRYIVENAHLIYLSVGERTVHVEEST